MESIALASESLEVLHLVMCSGLIALGMGLALMGGTMLAWAMSPICPSDMCPETFDFQASAAQRYAETQAKLANVRMARATILHNYAHGVSAPACDDLITQIDPVRSIVVC